MSRPGAVIINLTLVISIMLCPVVFAQDPCASCPTPGTLSCFINQPACDACWAACGQPIATPTPTVTPTPPPTPTPTGPECILYMLGPGSVFLVAFWEHEGATGKRYTFTVYPKTVLPGPWRGDPSDVEGHPVGYQWWDANGTTLLKSCGDTTPLHWHIFSDGFETGDISKW